MKYMYKKSHRLKWVWYGQYDQIVYLKPYCYPSRFRRRSHPVSHQPMCPRNELLTRCYDGRHSDPWRHTSTRRGRSTDHVSPGRVRCVDRPPTRRRTCYLHSTTLLDTDMLEKARIALSVCCINYKLIRGTTMQSDRSKWTRRTQSTVRSCHSLLETLKFRTIFTNSFPIRCVFKSFAYLLSLDLLIISRCFFLIFSMLVNIHILLYASMRECSSASGKLSQLIKKLPKCCGNKMIWKSAKTTEISLPTSVILFNVLHNSPYFFHCTMMPITSYNITRCCRKNRVKITNRRKKPEIVISHSEIVISHCEPAETAVSNALLQKVVLIFPTIWQPIY